eukprot:143675-Chlamydomonas_euryale.AAC.1
MHACKGFAARPLGTCLPKQASFRHVIVHAHHGDRVRADQPIGVNAGPQVHQDVLHLDVAVHEARLVHAAKADSHLNEQLDHVLAAEVPA